MDTSPELNPESGMLSSTKRNRLSSHEKTQRDLQCISVGSQCKKASYHMVLSGQHFGKGEAMETVHESGVATASGEGRNE